MAGGTTVTITGTGFTGATAVDFGTAGGEQFHGQLGDTQITATSPAETAGTVDVTVVTPGGTSATSSADQFTYVAGAGGDGRQPGIGSRGGRHVGDDHRRRTT